MGPSYPIEEKEVTTLWANIWAHTHQCRSAMERSGQEPGARIYTTLDIASGGSYFACQKEKRRAVTLCELPKAQSNHH